MLGFFRNVIAFIFGAAAVVSFLGAPALLVYRGYFWLKFGHELEFSGVDLYSAADMHGVLRAVLEIRWLGVQKVLLWALSQPAELCLVMQAIAFGALSGLIHDENAKSLEPFYKPEEPAEPKPRQWLGRDV